jgi:hypothetical protein
VHALHLFYFCDLRINFLFLKDLPTAILSLKTAKRGTIFDRKYDESSDDTVNKLLKNLDKGKHSIAYHRLISPLNDNCVPLLVHTPLSARLCALYDKSFAHIPNSEIYALCENLLSHYSVTPYQQQGIEKLTRKQANCKQWHKVR